MTILVGFHLEGHDHFVLQAVLAKLLGLTEDDINADLCEAEDRGWASVLESMKRALKRFYARGAQCAVVGIDNDGNCDLDVEGIPEDPCRPRHWNHPGEFKAKCRYCQVEKVIHRTRPSLTWVPQKPGESWPILIAVPVEMIESWLLVMKGVLDNEPKLLCAERGPRATQKVALYQRPVASKKDVIRVALPLVRRLQKQDLDKVRQHSRSFSLLMDQVIHYRDAILGPRDCWQVGNGAANRDLA